MEQLKRKHCGGSEVEAKAGDLTLCDRTVVKVNKSIFNEDSMKLFNLLFMIFLL